MQKLDWGPGRLRIVMMGTGPFAVPTFRALLDSQHEVLALTTRPDRRGPGDRAPPVNPMRNVAQERGLNVEEPESINAPEAVAALKAHEADLLVVCDYGQILSREVLGAARLGAINLHASLLPKYRGAAPINWAIYNGERETGVTVFQITPAIDAGPWLAQHKIPIPAQATAIEIEEQLSQIGVGAVAGSVAKLARHVANGEPLEGIPQSPTGVTRAPRLKKSDGQVNWDRTAQQIFDQVRALIPWPKTFTQLERAGHETLRLILEEVAVMDALQLGKHEVTDAVLAPGTVVAARGELLAVACTTGVLQILRLQPAGKRVMSAGEFLRGTAVHVGERFGASNST